MYYNGVFIILTLYWLYVKVLQGYNLGDLCLNPDAKTNPGFIILNYLTDHC